MLLILDMEFDGYLEAYNGLVPDELKQDKLDKVFMKGIVLSMLYTNMSIVLDGKAWNDYRAIDKTKLTYIDLACDRGLDNGINDYSLILRRFRSYIGHVTMITNVNVRSQHIVEITCG